MAATCLVTAAHHLLPATDMSDGVLGVRTMVTIGQEGGRPNVFLVPENLRYECVAAVSGHCLL